MRTPLVALLASLVLIGTVGVATPAAAATTAVTTKAGATTFRTGEGQFFTGKVTVSGKARARVAVSLVRVAPDGAKVVLAKSTTSSTGRYSLPLTPTMSARYYVRTSAAGAVKSVRSPLVSVRYTRAAQTIATRAAALGTRAGAAKSGVKTLSSSARKRLGDSSVTSVRYQDRVHGMLVEVVRKGTKRTWFVPSKIRTRVLATGGVSGTFGVPRRDAECVTLESGCVQQFSKVAAYQNATKRSAFYQKGSGWRAEYLATARSQVGYAEPSWRRSKYNAWVGGSEAWCGVFQEWVAAASGNPTLLPRKKTFEGLVASAKKTMTTYTPRSTKHRPRAGTLVFFAFKTAHPHTASHVGVLLSRSGSTVTVIEGNASKGGKFTSDRGVYIHQRKVASILFYADPVT